MKLKASVCFVLVALAMAGCKQKVKQIEPDIRSRLGESCGATNDCDKGLACVEQRCIKDEFPVKPTAKYCFQVQCQTDGDCCKDFEPDESCVEWKAQCAAEDIGFETYCSLWEEFCQCQSECKEDRTCGMREQTCTEDLDCGSYFCVSGACVECKADTDCTNTGDKCIDHFCQEPCEKNEDCPVFNTCTNGDCVETGCTSDRECILWLQSPLAACEDKQCRIPCETNAQCGSLQSCENGTCTFIGCDTANDCRAYFANSYVEDWTAECRPLQAGEQPPEGSSDDFVVPSGTSEW